jgi:hypothetical protein
MVLSEKLVNILKEKAFIVPFQSTLYAFVSKASLSNAIINTDSVNSAPGKTQLI